MPSFWESSSQRRVPRRCSFARKGTASEGVLVVDADGRGAGGAGERVDCLGGLAVLFRDAAR
jgi:hypothetical protein